MKQFCYLYSGVYKITVPGDGDEPTPVININDINGKTIVVEGSSDIPSNRLILIKLEGIDIESPKVYRFNIVSNLDSGAQVTFFAKNVLYSPDKSFDEGITFPAVGIVGGLSVIYAKAPLTGKQYFVYIGQSLAGNPLSLNPSDYNYVMGS